MRLEVGETLAVMDVPPPLRLSKAAAFRFWNDCRPPFYIIKLERIDEGDKIGGRAKHADGVLFNVTYECGIDYATERAYSVTSEGGTFDNTIHGVAKIRIPDEYPKKRLVFLSWGHPVLGFTPQDEKKKQPSVGDLKGPEPEQLAAPVAAWSSPSAARGRPTKKAMLGAQVSLPRLAEMEDNPLASKTPIGRKREHRLYTSAAGFVRYVG